MRRFVAPAVLTLVAGACADEPRPTTTTTTTIAIELDTVPPITDLGAPDPAAVAGAEAAVLTAADVAGGWEMRPSVDPRARIVPSDCADNAVTLAAATGDDLVLPDGAIVSQSIVAGDAVVVDDAFDRLDPGCVARVTRRVAETLIAALPGTPRGVTIGEPEVTLMRRSVDRAGVDAHAITAEFPIRVDSVDGVMFVHVIAVRAADVLVVLTARRPATSLTAAEIEALTDLAAQQFN